MKRNIFLTAFVVLFIAVGANAGLISQYEFEGNANDSVGSNNGTLVNGASIVNDAGGGLKLPSQILNLDGINDRVNCGTTNMENLSQVTLTAWVNWNGSTPVGYSFISGIEGVYKIDFIPSQGKIRFLTGNNWTGTILTSSTVLASNTWYHIAATYDGSKKYIYINGTRETNFVTTSGSLGPNTYHRDFTMGSYDMTGGGSM